MAMTSTMQLLVLSFLVIASLFLGATVAPPASLISTPDQALKDKADLIVAKDGSGNFTTVNEAVAAAPENGVKPFVIYIKEGLYKEVIRIGKKKTNLTLVGDGRDLTVLSGDLNFIDGIKTFYSATLGKSFSSLSIMFLMMCLIINWN
ncbi:putative hydrolase [Arabidopsis thaliana]